MLCATGGGVVGFGFNANGRYGQGGADPRALRATAARCGAREPARRERHEPRSGPHLGLPDAQREARRPWRALVAVGTIDMAVWDAVAKIAGKPLFRLLAERQDRQADPRVLVYAAGRLLLSGQGPGGAPRRDARLSAIAAIRS